MNTQATNAAMTLKQQIIETTLKKNVLNTVSHKNNIFKFIQNDLIPFAKIETGVLDQNKTEDDVKMTFGELGSVDMKFVWEIMHSFKLEGSSTIREPKPFFDKLAKMLPGTVETKSFVAYNGNVTVTFDTVNMGWIRLIVKPDGSVTGQISSCKDLAKACEKMRAFEDSPISAAELSFKDKALRIAFTSGEELNMTFNESGVPMTKVKSIL